MEYSNYKVKLPRNCPECGELLEEFFQNNRKFLGCSGFPNCRFTMDVLNYAETLSIREKDGKIQYPGECPLCRNKLVIYIGIYSPFFGILNSTFTIDIIYYDLHLFSETIQLLAAGHLVKMKIRLKLRFFGTYA